MEKNTLNRKTARERAFLMVYALSVNPDQDIEEDIPLPDEELDLTLDAFAKELIEKTLSNIEEIDSTISPCLSGWTLNRIPSVSKALLRLSTAQLLYMKDIPDSVVINEAVELSKHYGSDNDYSFVNGALGSIARSLG